MPPAMISLPVRSLGVLIAAALIASALAGCRNGDTALNPTACLQECGIKFDQCSANLRCTSNSIREVTCCRVEPPVVYQCSGGSKVECYCNLDDFKALGYAAILLPLAVVALILICCCCCCCMIFKKRKARKNQAATEPQHAAEDQARIDALNQPEPEAYDTQPPPPSQAYPQPSQAYPQPSQEYPKPSQDHSKPSQEYSQPPPPYPQPTQTYPQPTQTYPQPTQTYPQPSEPYAQPAEVYPQAGYPQPVQTEAYHQPNAPPAPQGGHLQGSETAAYSQPSVPPPPPPMPQFPGYRTDAAGPVYNSPPQK